MLIANWAPILIPTYKVGPNEIVLRITEGEFAEINAALSLIEQRRRASRTYAQKQSQKETKRIKPIYKLALPTDMTQGQAK